MVVVLLGRKTEWQEKKFIAAFQFLPVNFIIKGEFTLLRGNFLNAFIFDIL